MLSLASSIGSTLRRVGPAVLFSFLLGCASQPRIDWNSRIGIYTHDQAILEMGPPDKSATLTDGSKIAEWLIAHGRIYGFMDGGMAYDRHYPFYGGPYMRQYSITPTPDEFLRLTFTPEGRLQAWSRVAR